MTRSRRDLLKTLGAAAALGAIHRWVGAAQVPQRSRVFTAPAGAELSKAFAVNLNGESSPVYVAKVAPGDDARRWRAMDRINEDIFEEAAFTTFDMRDPIEVVISCPKEVTSVRILPTSAQVIATMEPRQVRFVMDRPRALTVEINGDPIHSLHVFGNEMPEHVPAGNEKNVIYFGPGLHEVNDTVVVGEGQTLYLAGGAILRAVGKSGPVIHVKGNGAKIRGRGIVDGGMCPIHSRNLLFVEACRDVLIEGVILHDSPTWNLPIRRSDGIAVKNVKIIGHRANSDGIDICNSRDVRVEGCFLRTLDDLVVVKTDRGQGVARGIEVRDCVLWNQVAHALSIGAELREDVSNVVFRDCDVIHDIGREWTLRIFQSDAATISDVRFERIRVEESRRLISLWIGKAVWSRDEARGHIKDIRFENIRATGNPATVELKGFDAEHRIQGVQFRDVTINGRKLSVESIETNAFVDGLSVE